MSLENKETRRHVTRRAGKGQEAQEIGSRQGEKGTKYKESIIQKKRKRWDKETRRRKSRKQERKRRR